MGSPADVTNPRHGGDPTRQATFSFTRDSRLVSDVRRAVGEQLEQWGLGPERSALELVSSELFTNALVHGRGGLEVRLDAQEDLLRLEVSDQGGGRPILRPIDPSGAVMGGWGLHLVDQLADAWGSEVRDGRTVVWVERAVQPEPP